MLVVHRATPGRVLISDCEHNNTHSWCMEARDFVEHIIEHRPYPNARRFARIFRENTHMHPQKWAKRFRDFIWWAHMFRLLYCKVLIIVGLAKPD